MFLSSDPLATFFLLRSASTAAARLGRLCLGSGCSGLGQGTDESGTNLEIAAGSATWHRIYKVLGRCTGRLIVVHFPPLLWTRTTAPLIAPSAPAMRSSTLPTRHFPLG